MAVFGYEWPIACHFTFLNISFNHKGLKVHEEKALIFQKIFSDEKPYIKSLAAKKGITNMVNFIFQTAAAGYGSGICDLIWYRVSSRHY